MVPESLESSRQISTLEEFTTDSPDLEELGRLAKEFDHLNILGMSSKEEIHSDPPPDRVLRQRHRQGRGPDGEPHDEPSLPGWEQEGGVVPASDPPAPEWSQNRVQQRGDPCPLDGPLYKAAPSGARSSKPGWRNTSSPGTPTRRPRAEGPTLAPSRTEDPGVNLPIKRPKAGMSARLRTLPVGRREDDIPERHPHSR